MMGSENTASGVVLNSRNIDRVTFRGENCHPWKSLEIVLLKFILMLISA